MIGITTNVNFNNIKMREKVEQIHYCLKSGIVWNETVKSIKNNTSTPFKTGCLVGVIVDMIKQSVTFFRRNTVKEDIKLIYQGKLSKGLFDKELYFFVSMIYPGSTVKLITE